MGIIVIAAPLFAVNDYVDSCIVVAWRSYLAHRLLSSYFGDDAYYRLKLQPDTVDNPDQVGSGRGDA